MAGSGLLSGGEQLFHLAVPADRQPVHRLAAEKEAAEGVEPAVSLDDEERAWAEPANWEGDPQVQLERSEQGKALARGLARLSEEHRRILVLRELSGLSYQEISQTLELDLGTVKSRIARARLALRKILLEDGNFFDKGPSNPVKRKERG